MADNAMEILISVLKMILALLPFLLICYISGKLNIVKQERSKQFFMPVIALIYSVVTIIFSDKINSFLIKKVGDFAVWLTELTGINGLPASVNSFISDGAKSLAKIINDSNIAFWVFFIANTFILIVYLLVKAVTIVILHKSIKNNGQLHSAIAGGFYEYHEDKDVWCVKDNLVQVRAQLRVFYFACFFITVVLMMVSKKWYLDGVIKTVYYPVYSIILLGEVYFYLDGLNYSEYLQNILGENENATKTINYSLLRKYLRNLFGDKLLTENTMVNNLLSYNTTNEDVIKKLEESSDAQINLFAKYVRKINSAGFEIDHNYIFSTVDLIHGQSVLFNNPFYNDLIPYAFFPMNAELLKHNKVLVLLGRHSIENDIVEWIKHGIGSVTNIPYMWDIEILNNEKIDADIGVVTRSDILNGEIISNNSDFFKEVTYCVIIEPSRLLPTAQIGLDLIVKNCRDNQDKKITFCLCDKNSDGLVDSLSHVLTTSITKVTATNKHKGTSSYMCWDTDETHLHHRILPNISRYLGTGTELSFVALKNQVSKAVWYGGETFPVTDISWIDRQYYFELNKYAGIPANQESFFERFETTDNFWSAKITDNNYFTVEDESYNMFEVLRDFSTRSKDQGFINVICSDYLLKDYMAVNSPIFEVDSKAIPYFAADFARTERNVALKIMAQLDLAPIRADKISAELDLLGVDVYDIPSQLWLLLYKYCNDTTVLQIIPDDYKEAVLYAQDKTISVQGISIDSNVIEMVEKFSVADGSAETFCVFKNKSFADKLISGLNSAAYIVEDENGNTNYLGAELAGHIYQKMLPGQFFTFGGKYYEMQYLTAENKVVVRRASDHIDSRKFYRQIRNYNIVHTMPLKTIGSVKNISGLRISKEYADFSVKTYGYYCMEKYSDFENAQKVIFENDISSVPIRTFVNKQILRIDFPDKNGKYTDKIRHTVTMLLNEIFRTLYAENQEFIIAVTDTSSLEDAGFITYSVTGDNDFDKSSIYIIEDSNLDLGLLISVERNFQRFLKIIDDYIDWHLEEIEISRHPPVVSKPFVPTAEDMVQPEAKPTLLGKIKKSLYGFVNIFRKLFHLQPLNNGEPEKGSTVTVGQIPQSDNSVTDESLNSADDTTIDNSFDSNTEVNDIEVNGTTKSENSVSENDSSDIASAAEKVRSDDESNKAIDYTREPYYKNHFLLFGRETVPEAIDLVNTLTFLNEMGCGRNELKQAREARKHGLNSEEQYVPNKPGARYCDFCGTEIFGVEYETLADGRDRCINCGNTAIKTAEDFKKIFNDVKRNMEAFYGIKINAGIRVEMVNSKKLHKCLKKTFVPTNNSDARIIGVAIKDKSGYSMYIENGAPRVTSMLTIAHELTHIWQYLNWNEKEIRSKYTSNSVLEVYEGMAKWVEIQYAYLINESITAKREEIMTLCCDNEYGRGLNRYILQYPFSTGTSLTNPTPFLNLKEPLSNNN